MQNSFYSTLAFCEVLCFITVLCIFSRLRSHPRKMFWKIVQIQRIFLTISLWSEKKFIFVIVHKSLIFALLHYWWHLHTKDANTYFLLKAVPLIYHVFNVEQDQVVEITSRYLGRHGIARAQRDRNKTKVPVKVMNCLANAHDSTHRLDFILF